jgi:Cysteine-rich secretory protein family
MNKSSSTSCKVLVVLSPHNPFAYIEPPTPVLPASFTFCNVLYRGSLRISLEGVFNRCGSLEMSTTLRRLTILAVLAVLVLLLTPILHAAGDAKDARPPVGTPESILFDAANHDRAAAGLPLFQWDKTLAASARAHAKLMAQHNTLSHQFPGEPALQERATQAGARFSVIAENVAEGPSASGLHTQWMNSAPHRANLMATDMSAIGIAVVQGGNMLFAVEDFSQPVPSLNLELQESQVSTLLSSQGLRMLSDTPDARKTCDLERGWAGDRPLSVVRYETADLSRLPEGIEQKVVSGKYRTAAVGACDAGGPVGFARFRIAILLF